MARRRGTRVDPLAPMTYMIAEMLIDKIDVTAYRGFGIGERNPATLPGVRMDSESEHTNRKHSADWKALRKWAQSSHSVGYKAFR